MTPCLNCGADILTFDQFFKENCPDDPKTCHRISPDFDVSNWPDLAETIRTLQEKEKERYARRTGT